MKPSTKKKREPGSQQRIVSLCGATVSDYAKREIAAIWVECDDNTALAVLQAFRVGFKAGASAQANDEISERRK